MDPFKEARKYADTLPPLPFFDESKRRLLNAEVSVERVKAEDASRVRSEVIKYIEILPNFTQPKENLIHALQRFDDGSMETGEFYELYYVTKNNLKSGRQKALDYIQEVINRRGSREAIHELRKQLHRLDQGLLSDAVLAQFVEKAKRDYIKTLC